VNSFLRELRLLVPPPPDPRNARGDWRTLEAEMGLVFPDDYKQFIGLYGTGTMCSLFEIDSPFLFSEFYRVPVREAWITRTGIYRELDRFSENPLPYPVYPEIPGLLSCATYGTTDIIGWLTNLDPQLWYLVYRDRENGYFELRGMGFVEFLVAAIKGETPMPETYFSKAILNESRVFNPY
jgi:hypothetical protein